MKKIFYLLPFLLVAVLSAKAQTPSQSGTGTISGKLIDLSLIHISPSANYLSDIHQVNFSPVPLHDNATLWIKTKTDIPEYRTKYGIVKIGKNGKTSWMGGKYTTGGIETTIGELGQKYAVDIDTIAPEIVPQTPEKWVANRRIRIAATDDKSGIQSFRGEIDGKFALFTHDIKSLSLIHI